MCCTEAVVHHSAGGDRAAAGHQCAVLESINTVPDSPLAIVPQRSRFAPVMRELVGRLLGIGMCDGKQLAKQLNLFGFTHGEVMYHSVACHLSYHNHKLV